MVAVTVLFSCALSPARMTAQSAPSAAGSHNLKITVSGDVTTPLTLTESDLAALPREHVDLAGTNGAQDAYDGVPLQEILKKAGTSFGHVRGKALSSYVLAEGSDGYEVVFSLGELDPDFGGAHILVADQKNGKPLAEKEGPARLVIPADEAGARSVRMLEKIEVVQLRK
jgi:DMSO/TMAO reductase YedYZ molybdopterin-dependent catalytic subunit